MAKNFIEEFEIKTETLTTNVSSDYDTFPNKILLDELRNKIIGNLIDNNIANTKDINTFVKKQMIKEIIFII